MPHKPNPTAAGTRLGIRLTMPILNERSATTRMTEIAARAADVPSSIVRLFLCPMFENVRAGLPLVTFLMDGAFSFTHAWIRLSSSSAS